MCIKWIFIYIYIHSKYSIIIFVLLYLHIFALNCWLHCAPRVQLWRSKTGKSHSEFVPWENNGIQRTKKWIWTDFMIYDGIQILHIIRYMFEDRIPGAWISDICLRIEFLGHGYLYLFILYIYIYRHIILLVIALWCIDEHVLYSEYVQSI